MNHREILEEISEWKLEAKLEDNERYFYHTSVVDKILNGKRLYIIGRKGSGKTAISENLSTLKRKNVFAKKLTFKNFPFNKLYNLSDRGFTSPNQYITIWKYVIYLTVCQLLSEDASIESTVRNSLKKAFPNDISQALPTVVEEVTQAGYNLEILNLKLGLNYKREKNPKFKQDLEWIQKVEMLESFLQKNIGNAGYLVIFDELDEDYKDITSKERYSQYTELLTSLFKAAQDVRSKFSSKKLYPVIFLRDDIYEVLQDPDKTKWTDHKIDLNWNEDSIKNMLAFRISRAIDRSCEPTKFNQAWNMIFETQDIKFGHKQKRNISSFNYIKRNSFMRPRDYIKYIQLCAQESCEKNSSKISPATVANVDSTFSTYLRSELEDEIHGILPNIHDILDLFSIPRKQTISIQEFREHFERAISQRSEDFVFVLKILFHFSIIGNQPKQHTMQVFRYKSKDAQLNMRESLIVHRGLYKSLQIY